MEKQCYELVSGMEGRCVVHRLVYDKKEAKPLFFLSLGRRISKILDKYQGINIIHFNDALIASAYSFQKLDPRIKYVVTLHGLDVVFPSSIYHQYIFKRLNRYTCMVAVSRATAAKSIELGIDRQKITVIPNGVDISNPDRVTKKEFNRWLSEKQVDHGGKTILMMMGRAVSRKGFSWFANHVFPLLTDDFLLIMAGPFRHKPSLQERAIYLLPDSFRKKLMLFLGYASDERDIRRLLCQSERVTHLGRLSSEEVNLLFQHADAFLMPNIQVEGDMEGFGLVCLEAAVHGTLVFAADTDGIPDAIKKGKNGFLLPSGNPKAWAEKLNDFRKNKFKYKQHQSEFKQYTRRNYNWEKMVDNYFRLFEKLQDLPNTENTEFETSPKHIENKKVHLVVEEEAF
jgi:phosphatidylinositol alpha-1,6-mannosyltransferase